jgi:outer membrane protein assembly factor BamB
VHTVDALELIPDGIANLVLVDPNGMPHLADAGKLSLVKKLQPEASLVAPEAFLHASQAEAYGLSARVDGTSELSNVSVQLYSAPAREGAAGWTHMYGRPDNSAYAGETLGGASSIDQLRVAWAGRPGPRYQADRGNRKPSPLATDGRLFLQGLHRLIGMDAHNGQILWSRELPEMVRFNVPRDCSNWCADDHDLYVALQSRCKVIDGMSGQDLAEYEVWNPTDRPLYWGFVARSGDLLLGTGVQPDALFTEFWGSEFWYDAKEGEAANKVCSDSLFALDAKSGLPAWTYQAGLIVNPTISLQDDKLIFVECRSKPLQSQAARRLGGDEFWNHLYVVCLNIESGDKLWEVPAKPMPGVSALYGVCSPDHYLLQTSDAGSFALYALDLDDGKMTWRGKYAWEADHHGKHLSRPAVVGGKIYLRPLTLDLSSGKVLADKFPAGHQCGTYTATKNALFLRAGNLTVWDGESTAATRWERLRPDCWISTIPAEGMLLSPEGGGGCSCGGWIETSIGFSSIAGQ